MIGCRPLTDDEVRAVSEQFNGEMEHRNRVLFWLGITTGFRISELLSIQFGDVWRSGRIPDQVRIARKNVKGRKRGQSAHIAPAVRPLINRWLFDYRQRYAVAGDSPLFISRSGENRPISRMQAHRTLAAAFTCAGLDGAVGELATHSMRKTYAATMFDHFGDIFAVQRALRHKSPASTVAYLSFNEQDLEHAVELKWPDEGQQPEEPTESNVVPISRKEA